MTPRLRADGDVIAEDIYGKTGQKVLTMTLISNKQEFRFVRIQLQLVFIHPSEF